MFGSVVLDVAIGLGLLFLFVSLICSAIREAIETVLNDRGAELERALRQMMDDPGGTGAARALFAHPLIHPLLRGAYRPERLRPRGTGGPAPRMGWRERARLPPYIPARAFARAWLDLVLRGPVGEAPRPAPVLTVAALRARADAMPDDRTRRVLLGALDGAGEELAAVERAVMRWFDGCMARLSGLYRRRTQAVLFGVGLLVAAGMNVDAFSVGRALFQDEALRDGAVAQAAALVAPPSGRPDGSGADTAARAASAFAALRGELGAIRFPTGWGRPLPQPFDTPGHVLQVLAGWLVTAFATTLGAPFWFDLLSRFVVVRASKGHGED